MDDYFHFAHEHKLIYICMHIVRLCDDILSVSKVMLSVSERKITKFIGLNTVGEMKAAV
jgi:hypothetical protein